jgi:hypothetical protein
MELTDAIKEAYANAPADVTYFNTLIISNASFAEDIMIVQSNADLVTNQGTYTPAMFTFSLPDIEGGVIGEMVITLSFLPKESRKAIRDGAAGRHPTTILFQQYINDSPDPDAVMPFGLEVVGVKETPTGVEARAVVSDITKKYFPKRIMTSTTCPGMR